MNVRQQKRAQLLRLGEHEAQRQFIYKRKYFAFINKKFFHSEFLLDPCLKLMKNYTGQQHIAY